MMNKYVSRFSKSIIPVLLLSLITAGRSIAQVGPAGVNTGIGAWWRGDAGASNTSWTDQSGNSRTLAQGAPGNKPVYISNGINFLPTLDFGTNDVMSSATVFGTGSTQNVAIFAVAQPEDYATTGGRLCAEYTSNGYAVGIHFPYVDNNMYWDAPYGYRISGAWQGQVNNPYVVSTTKTPNAMYAYNNHKTVASYTAGNLTCVCPGNNSSFTVGGYSGGYYFGGKISEVIVYKNSASLTALDRQKIESYLALKYGITLDQTSPYNYVASDGTTIMWNASLNATWNRNITGVGRDNLSSLHQRQGRAAIAAGRIWTVALGTTVAADNASNANSVTTDKSFLVFGDNGGSTLISNVAVAGSGVEKIMSRTWRVQKTAWTDQNITMNAGVNYAGKFLVISTASSSFATITSTIQLDGTGSATFNSSLLPNGAYFTIGQAPTGPGGVTGNIRVWLDGSKSVYQLGGTIPAADGAAADQWNDQSQSTTGNLFRSTGSNSGTVTYRAAGINYNGALEMDNVTMRGFTNKQITSPALSNFIVVNPQNPGSGHRQYVLYSNASGGYDYNTALEQIPFHSANGISTHRAGYETPYITPAWGQQSILTSVTTSTTHSAGYNGRNLGTSNYSKGAFGIDQYFVGGGYAAGWCCGATTKERYGEVLTYDRAVTTVERQRIESYLALKYGISIDQTTATDYFASDWNGTTGTRMWTAASNAGFGRKIFGIGRDDFGQLYQKQSTSSDTNNIWGIAMGSTFPKTNELNSNSIAADKTFLVFGSNGLATKTNVPVTGLTNAGSRMARIWKISKSAGWTNANVTVQTIGTAAKYLLVSSDAVFGAGDAEFALDGNGQVTINSSVLQDSYYLTFGDKPTGPAGVNSGIALWLDARTNTPGSVQNGIGWKDNSGNNRDFRQMNSTAATRVDAGINFNHYINFNGGYLSNIDGAFASNVLTQGEAIVVTKSNGVFNGQGNPYDFGSNSRGNHIRWGDGSDYNGFGTNDRIGYNPLTNGVTDAKAGATVTGRGYDPGNWVIHGTYSMPGSWGASYNGLLKVSTNTNAVSFYSPVPEYVGAFHGSVYIGNIAEVVLYNRKLTAPERLQVNSYLGLKYGITVDQTVAQDYVASDGTTKMWTNDGDGFRLRITGLGRDNTTYLHQKMATNQDTGTIWTIGLGSTLTGLDNFNNPAAIAADKTFFTFADNNAATQYLSNVVGSANVNVRMNRTWKVDKSATWTDQNVTFSAGSSYGSKKYLLISTAASFATIAQELLLDAEGKVTVNTSLLPHNAYFTIGTKIIGPASVNLGVAAWYRADDNASGPVWNDYSGNDNTAAQGTGTNQPALATGNVFNYNPAMRFDGSNDYMVAPSLFARGMNNIAVFAAGNVNSAHNGIAYSEYASNGSYLEFLQHWSDGNSYWDAPYGYRVNAASGVTPFRTYIWTAQRTPTSMGIWRNRSGVVTTTGTFANFNGAGNFYIGNRQDLGFPLNGRISELIVYNNAASMTANQRRAIETYLSIKYGTSLDSAQGNYIAYDSTAIYDLTANAGYRWRVTGIGRDDRSGLVQKQSRNWDTSTANAAGYVAMGLSVIEADNATNVQTFGTDKSYLVWGDNNGTGITSTTVAGSTVTPNNPTLFNGLTGCAALARFNKIYRVQKTGSVGAVQVQVNTTGLNVGKLAGDYYLAINNTASFNSGTVQQLVQATSYDRVSRTLTFDNVVFNSGDYFTVIGKKVQAPANVVSGIRLWLKAEDGVTYDAGRKISGWDDQSPSNRSLTQTIAAAQPTYRDTGLFMNFNPTVSFDGGDVLAGSSLLGTATHPGATFFTVSNQSVTTASSIFFEPSVGTQFNLHAVWSDNNIYWDPPVTSNRAYAAAGNIANQNILWSGFSKPSNTTGNRQAIYRDGRAMALTGGGSGTTALTGVAGAFSLGGSSTTSGNYIGRIGELIVYTDSLGLDKMQKIQSYLAVKWGISLDQTAATSYYASDWNGTTGTKIWDAAATGASAYKYRITGIGRDDCSDLNQLQSRNQDTSSKGYVTIGRNTISFSNPGNPNTFTTDRSYLLWGDDNGSGLTPTTANSDGTTTITSTGCVNLRRMSKKFRVAVSGTPGTVQVQVNINGLSLGKKAADLFLARNSSVTGSAGNNFNSGTYGQLIPASSYINGIVTFDNVTFSNNDSFTVIGQRSQAPAGVVSTPIVAGIGTTIRTWLKAEDGITLSGSNVASWEDQSSGGINATQSTAGLQPAFSSSLINFNPAVTSAGNERLQLSANISHSGMRVLAVGTPYLGSSNWRTLLNGFNGSTTIDHAMIIQAGNNLYGYFDDNSGGFKSAAQNMSGLPQIFSMDLTPQTVTPSVMNAAMGINGLNTGTASGMLANRYSNVLLNYYAGTQPWGALSEMVVYNSTDPLFATVSLPKIQSYMALKYGISLQQPASLTALNAVNYIASDGTVLWNAFSNNGYNNRITGIGRDDCSDLSQLQSRNVDTSSSAGWAMMARGDLYQDNESNPNTFASDKSFLIWGDDNAAGISTAAITGDGSATLPQSGSCTQFRRLAKTYKVSSFVNGTAAANAGVQVSINTRGLNFGGSTAGVYLAVNSSSTFSGTVTKLVPASDFANNIYVFDNVSFANGDYFTLVGPAAVAPANVFANLSLWLRADNADDITLNGSGVQQWNDESIAGNHISQATAANQPVYSTSQASLINFNPSVQFDGTNDALQKVTGILANGTVYTGNTLFAVNNSLNPSAAQRLMRQQASADLNLYAPHANTYYYDAPDRIFVGTSVFSGMRAQITTAVRDNTRATTDLVGAADTSQIVYANGKAVIAGNAVATYTGNNGTFTLGTNNVGSEFYNGRVGELIFYSGAVPRTDRQKINSYLSVKWGISMDTNVLKVPAAANNYLASDGTTIWSANNQYYYRVTGIGRDDCSILNQKQSRNQDTTSGLIIGLGSIDSSNMANANTFGADKSFDIISDDNGGTTFTTAVTGTSNGVNARMTRVWRATESGTVGTVRIAMRANKVANPANAYLIVNNGSASFTSSSTFYPLSATTVNGARYYYADANLINNDYFTFGSDVRSPGGVAGTTVWMRPDYGTSTNIDGGALEEWQDYAANLKHASQFTTGYQPRYVQNVTDNINFNPVVKFDGTDDHLDFDDQLGLVGTNLFTIASVTKPTTFSSSYKTILASSGSAVNGLLYAHNPTDGKQVVYHYNVGVLGSSTTVGLTSSVNARMLTRGASNLYSFFNAGKADGTFTNATSYAVAPYQSIGGGYTGGLNSPYAGTMGDVIVYPFDLNATDRQRVETYLAIKYGYTIDQTTATDYLATDGTTKVWDAAANSAYKTNIAGIGRDDAEGLVQAQSRSVNAGLQVAVANGNFADDNLTNGNSFSADKSYMIWGDNAGATTYTTTVSGAVVNTRMPRLWKTQVTGSVGSVQVAIPANAIANPAATYLIRSSDATIDNTDTYVKLDSVRINGALHYAANTTLSSGDFFTFGSNLKLPGGIAGVSLWLRPDYGTGSTTDGAAISEWQDAAGQVNHATQATAAAQPLYKDNQASNVNFNPTVSFDGTNHIMNLDVAKLPVGSAARTLYSVSRPATTGGLYTIGWGNSGAVAGTWSSLATSGGSALFVGYSADLTSAATVAPAAGPITIAATYAGGAGGNMNLYVRNKLVAGPIARSLNTTATAAYVGGASNAAGKMNGGIGDVIVYPIALTATERQRVESYLAVKYGYTLDQSGAALTDNDYIASDGTTRHWTANGTYKTRVTGIGRDDLTALDQRQSRNMDTAQAGFVTMGVNTVAATNLASTDSFLNNMSFLMWADDNVAGKALSAITTDGTTTLPNAGPCASYVRMAKNFQVQKTNFTQPVQVKININGLTIGKTVTDYYLAIDGSAVTSATTAVSKLIPASDMSNGVLTFDGVQFPGGTSYFTVIGQKVQAPASIQSASLKLWLKADGGTQLSGSNVAQWDDNSPALNNAVQTTAANQPAYNSATSLINFNPSLTFDGSTDRLSTTNPIFGTGNISVTTFGVVNTNNTSGFRYWLTDGTASTNNGVGYGHAGSNMVNVVWGVSNFSGGAITANTTNIETFTRDNGTNGRSNILNAGAALTTTGSAMTKTNGSGSIGSAPPTYAEFWSGQIGEIIAYESVLSAAERQKIHSYLAVKWGLTLDQTAPTDYLSSTGDTIWNKTTNAAYKTRITAIGVDSCFDMVQRQSRNQGTGSILTMGLGSIAATNAANTTDFSGDKNYVIIGDDNGLVTQTSTDLPSFAVSGSKRIAREWKAAVTGATPSSLQVQLDLSGSALAAATRAEDLILIIDNDGDGNFSTGTVTRIPATAFASNTATFDNVALSNGNVFSVITLPQPLTLNAQVWLQGAYAGGSMSTALKTAGLLPDIDPYGLNTAPVNTLPNAVANVVDWIKVELRDAASPATVVASRAGYVLSNGNIADTNGTQPLYFRGVDNGNYKIAVRHRNHLGVMTTATQVPNATTGQMAYDFRLQANSTGSTGTYGTNAQKQLGTAGSNNWGMWAGDVNGDGVVRSSASGGSHTLTTSDMSLIVNRVAQDGSNSTNVNTYTVTGVYAPEDVNMDGSVKVNAATGSDADFLKTAVKSATGNTLLLPTWIINAQLP